MVGIEIGNDFRGDVCGEKLTPQFRSEEEVHNRADNNLMLFPEKKMNSLKLKIPYYFFPMYNWVYLVAP